MRTGHGECSGCDAASAQPSEGEAALLEVTHVVQVGQAGVPEAPPPGRNVVLDHLLVHKARAVVPAFRGFVYHVPELEASGMFVPPAPAAAKCPSWSDWQRAVGTRCHPSPS